MGSAASSGTIVVHFRGQPVLDFYFGALPEASRRNDADRSAIHKTTNPPPPTAATRQNSPNAGSERAPRPAAPLSAKKTSDCATAAGSA